MENNNLSLNTVIDTRNIKKEIENLVSDLGNIPFSLMINVDLDKSKSESLKKMKDLTKSLQSSLNKEKLQLADKESLILVKNLIKEEEKLADRYQSANDKAEQLIKTQQKVQFAVNNASPQSNGSSFFKNEDQDEILTSLISKVQEFQTAFEGLSSLIANSGFFNGLVHTGTEFETVTDKVTSNLELFPSLLTTISEIVSSNFSSGISKEKYARFSCKGTDAQTQKCWENNKNYYLATA